ncbi:MAG: hypothetical protein AVDCRST_MAG76-1993, partial [uncultured Acidimicrobiales bacterium]
GAATDRRASRPPAHPGGDRVHRDAPGSPPERRRCCSGRRDERSHASGHLPVPAADDADRLHPRPATRSGSGRPDRRVAQPGHDRHRDRHPLGDQPPWPVRSGLPGPVRGEPLTDAAGPRPEARL